MDNGDANKPRAMKLAIRKINAPRPRKAKVRMNSLLNPVKAAPPLRVTPKATNDNQAHNSRGNKAINLHQRLPIHKVKHKVKVKLNKAKAKAKAKVNKAKAKVRRRGSRINRAIVHHHRWRSVMRRLAAPAEQPAAEKAAPRAQPAEEISSTKAPRKKAAAAAPAHVGLSLARTTSNGPTACAT
jgi:hypothetical protein